MASRRKARESALQMLYQWDLGKEPPDKVQELFWAGQKMNLEQGRSNPWNLRPIREDEKRDTLYDKTQQAFANELFQGTVASVEQIDAAIRRHAEHWRLERMAAVDRNILRLGIYELTQRRDTPPIVVINEALEIARKFSEEESVGFINGLLDKIRKQTETSTAAG